MEAPLSVVNLTCPRGSPLQRRDGEDATELTCAAWLPVRSCRGLVPYAGYQRRNGVAHHGWSRGAPMQLRYHNFGFVKEKKHKKRIYIFA
jgi:hypothetical protein